MGGRGSLGGTRSTYRGESTTLFRQKQAQGAGDAGSGGGGGSSKNKGGGAASASTGGIQGGSGSGGIGGGGSTVDTKPTETDQTTDTDSSTATDINEQIYELNDQQLKDLFEESEAYDTFAERDISESAYNREYRKAYDKWLISVRPDLEIDFSDQLPAEEREIVQALTNSMPEHVRKLLRERGLRIAVGENAEDTDAWAAWTTKLNIQLPYMTQDGRNYGHASFYNRNENIIFISRNGQGGSDNVMVHEMTHGIDAKWIKDDEPVTVNWVDPNTGSPEDVEVRVISRDDPDWVTMHYDLVMPVKGVSDWFDYFIGGPSRTDDRAGRSELFAEGLAAYYKNAHGEGGLTNIRAFLFHGIEDQATRYAVADKMVEIYRRYGLIT